MFAALFKSDTSNLLKMVAPVAAILIAGVTLSVTAAYLAQRIQSQKLIAVFNTSAAERVAAIEKELHQNLIVLTALKGFYLSSDEVTRQEFYAFTKPLLKSYLGLHSLQWIPIINHKNRRAFEQTARLAGFKGFVFSQRTNKGVFVPAEVRKFYYPAWYVRPQSAHSQVFGFDIGSGQRHKKALARARDTGRIVAATRIFPEFVPNKQVGLLAIIPIYLRNKPTQTVTQRRNHLKGFIAGEFLIDEVVAMALTHLAPQPIDIRIADATIPGKPGLLYRHKSQTNSVPNIKKSFTFKTFPDQHTFTKTTHLADRKWDVTCIPHEDFFNTRGSLLPFSILAVGFLSSILLAAYFGFLGNHRLHLQQINANLALEIMRRRQAQSDLKKYSQNLHGKVEKSTQDLKNAQKELLRKEKLAFLGQIVGGLSHELRGPLGAIKNASYYLKMALSDPESEVEEMLSIIDKEVRISNQTIGSVLSFARQNPPKRTSFAPAPAIAGILLRIPKPGNIEVANLIDGNTPNLMVDSDHFGQIVGNIILNAFQAMPGGGRLTIDFFIETSDLVTMRFQDTGCGIPEKIRKQVFEPLFTTKQEGVGLGLAITKTMVDANGGTIKVESQAGAGSTFTVELPVDTKTVDLYTTRFQQ
jgi:signal transduction histidine kinase